MSNLPAFGSSSPFDQIRRIDDDGNEYWFARDLMPLLGYCQWRRFEDAVDRAKFACMNSKEAVSSHFADADNLVERSQGGGSKQKDYRLSRYACYLVAMNGDPRKPEIAAAQTYFAVKTREAETAMPRQIELSADPLTAQLQALIEVRQAQLETDRRLCETDRRLSETDQRVAVLEQTRADAHKELIALPPATYEVPAESLDMKVRRVVNNYCLATGLQHSEVFKNLYQQHYYRYHRRVETIGSESKIQAFVRLGLIQSLYDLAVELFASQQSA